MEAEVKSAPNGGSWAAILAAGIGCAAIGVLTDLAERSKSFSAALTLTKPVGDLSGKTTWGIGCWLAAWAVLHLCWRRREFSAPGRIAALTVALVLLAMLAAFPPFFELFAAS